MYMLSNVEKGSMPWSRRVHFSIIRTKTFGYDRRPHSITMEIIAERGFITYTPCSFVHHFEKNSPRNRWRNLRRNDTSLSSESNQKRYDTDSISNIISDENMSVLKNLKLPRRLKPKFLDFQIFLRMATSPV
jgi:hypothetical protein